MKWEKVPIQHSSGPRWLVLGLTALAILLAAASPPGAQPQPTAKLYVVEMYDFYFDPPGLYLQPGDRVIWVMLEDHLADGHSATAYHPQFDKELRIPENAEAWSSKLLKQIGDSYEQTFEALGIHDYFCIPHEDSGMVGRIIVKEATGPGTKPLSEGVSPAGQSVMPTIEELLGPVGQIFNLQARINAVALRVRQQAREESLRLFDAISAEFRSGEAQENSLYAQLEAIGLLEPVLEHLSRLRDAIASEQATQEIVRIASDLKTLLDQAAQKLTGG
jgi:plastocyanin